MPLDYQVFDPSSCRFPRPRVPVLPRGYQPVTSNDSGMPPGSLPGAGQGVYFSRGRYALGEAYRRAGLDAGSVLLAPAYHCVTMLDPALSLGGEILIYPLTPELAPEMTALDALIERSTKPVKVLLATHYFGFVRDFSRLKQWCDTRGISFVEDCSHTLFTERYQASGAGQQGDYVASSPYKFFPSADGGWLYAPASAALAGAAPKPASWIAELRGVRHCLAAARQPRVTQEDIAGLEDQLALLAGKPPATGADQRCTRPAQSAQYQRDLEGRAALRGSRWLIEHHSVAAIVNRRRANYRRWLLAVADLPGCRPLYPELPEHVVPYMFPLYIDHPMPHFYWLKQLAVPVWRWDEIAVSDCPVAQDYRLHLLHLPCHQSLSDDEMNWLLTALGKVLSSSINGVQR
ncbi:MAG: DegT/DnrJ/EryC1/StrS aminotransferase family protein [Dechloromonas sp.]|nr:MAG: DegT/DnrJ/EryC1/StrS aminotransferase family protein [Dechloromonas sp.]